MTLGDCGNMSTIKSDTCNYCNNEGRIFEHSGCRREWVDCPFCTDNGYPIQITPMGYPKREKP